MHRDPSPAEACPTDPATGACAHESGAATPPPTVAGGGRSVWLRANGRPGVVIASLAVALGLALLLLARPWSRPVGIVTWLGGGGVLVAGAGGVLLTSRPRLVLEGDRVRVHLAPGRIDPVPLEIVECFFLGSRLEPPPSGDDSTGGARVRTLVMRIAERAVDHAARPTLPLWGAWSEGSVTFDGRWCEPLSVDLVCRLNRDLATAKRAARARNVVRGEAT
jgi:hypothetical protein